MKLRSIFISLLAVALGAAIVLGCNYGLGEMARVKRESADLALKQTLLPGSESFAEEAYSGTDDHIRAVWKGENGYVIETGEYGYADDVVLWVGVDNSGRVTGLVVRSLHETRGLGAGALTNVTFLSQYLDTTGNLTVGQEVDALTGATVTSKAITKAINSACAFVTGADVESAATEWGA